MLFPARCKIIVVYLRIKFEKKITRIILQIQLSAATLQGTLRVIKAMLQSSKYIVVSPTVLFSKFMKI